VFLGGTCKRREFMRLFGGRQLTWPLAAACAAPARRIYRVGFLSISFREARALVAIGSVRRRPAEPRLPSWRECHHRVRSPTPRSNGCRACRRLVRLVWTSSSPRDQSDIVAAMEGRHDHPDRHDHRCRPGQRRSRRSLARPAVTSPGSPRIPAARFWASGLSC